MAGSPTTLSGARMKLWSLNIDYKTTEPESILIRISFEINLFVADYHTSYFVMANNYPSYLVMADVVNRFYHYSYYHTTLLLFIN